MLWMSAEVDEKYGDDLRLARNFIEQKFNPLLKQDYGPGVVEWALITILRDKIDPGWGEVKKYHRKRRVMEFRLIIDPLEFEWRDASGQRDLVFASIMRSLDLFREMNLKNVEFDLDQFRGDLVAAAEKHGIHYPLKPR